jgi:hypothetical protein
VGVDSEEVQEAASTRVAAAKEVKISLMRVKLRS